MEVKRESRVKVHTTVVLFKLVTLCYCKNVDTLQFSLCSFVYFNPNAKKQGQEDFCIFWQTFLSDPLLSNFPDFGLFTCLNFVMKSLAGKKAIDLIMCYQASIKSQQHKQIFPQGNLPLTWSFRPSNSALITTAIESIHLAAGHPHLLFPSTFPALEPSQDSQIFT